MRRLLPVSFAVALTLTFGTADAWAKANQAAPAITSSPPAGSLAETRAEIEAALPFPVSSGLIDDDLIEYAQREAQSAALENFHGGSVLIIGGSGLALVLLIVLLLVLL
ncbi:MAG TPA: hypothetical protein VHL80_21650 [Polyangia bacterium]|nr:hypothetical protein [Polyangia bacterium]